MVSAAGALRRVGFLAPAVSMVAASALIWQPPLGIVVNGAILGCVTALLATGLALVYRANRVINFAQADLGAVPALLTVLLLRAWDWPFPVALGCGFLAATVLGALTEMLVVRRFFKAPRLILTVATIGVAQLLIALSLFMPRWFGSLNAISAYDPPLDVSFELGGVRFFGNDALTLIVTPIALAALAVFLRFSSLGMALRASAQSTERAALLGINVKRLHTLAWVIAALLGFTALFLRAGLVGIGIGTVLGPALLLRALAAAVIGRMQDMPTIVSAAIGLGVVDQAVRFAWDREAYRDAVIAVIVLGALVATRVRRRRGDETTSWESVREVRPIPTELMSDRLVRLVRIAALALVALFVSSLPLWLSESRLNLASAITIYGIVGLSLVVLIGWAGQVSLGQMAFAGLGAAVAGSVTSRLGWDLAIGLVAGGVAGSLATVAVGVPTLRTRGLAFAVATLAFSVVTFSYLLNPTFFGDSSLAVWDWLPSSVANRPDLFGSIPTRSETEFFYLSAICLALAMASVRSLRRSRTGRALIAARENENQAESYGVNAIRATVSAFAISGFLAGFAGALLFHHQQGLLISEFSPTASLLVFTMTVVGGLGSVGGAVLGAVYVRGVEWFLPAEYALLATGAGLLVVLMILPGGLGAALGDARDALLRKRANRIGLRVPSLVADTFVPGTAGSDQTNTGGNGRGARRPSSAGPGATGGGERPGPAVRSGASAETTGSEDVTS